MSDEKDSMIFDESDQTHQAKKKEKRIKINGGVGMKITVIFFVIIATLSILLIDTYFIGIMFPNFFQNLFKPKKKKGIEIYLDEGTASSKPTCYISECTDSHLIKIGNQEFIY